ncbi:AtpZ/AtpI family protein [bacterium]|nr:AtpZ/AtpI family protein [bacterium]
MLKEELSEELGDELSEEELKAIFSGPLLDVNDDDTEPPKVLNRKSPLNRLVPLSSVAISIADRKRLGVDDAEIVDTAKEENIQRSDDVEVEDNREEDEDSPEALQRRIERFKSKSAQRRGGNRSLQAVGLVFSFGFTIAAVILAFWWLAGQLVNYTGWTWIEGPILIIGVVAGFFSGGYMLAPYMRERSKAENR